MELRAATGKDNAVFHNIGRQFRRGLTQYSLDEVEDFYERFAHDAINFTGFDTYFALQAIVNAAACKIIAPVF